MNKIKFSHIVFSLALIAALALAMVPTAPAYALANSADNALAIEKQTSDTVLASAGGVVCKSVTVWRNGHRVVIRRCHKVTRPAA